MKSYRRFADDHTAPAPGRLIGLAPDHPAVRDGRPLFPMRVKSARDLPRILKSGSNNSKIGGRVVVGPWKGFPIVVLTLPERTTCPRSCHVWRQCMGNAMPLAMRVQPDDSFLPALHRELSALQAKPSLRGFVVRLHALGDFYSRSYAEFWEKALAEFPKLHIFGYTARDPSGRIGLVLYRMSEIHPDRCAIRFSHGAGRFGFPGVMQATTLARWNGRVWQQGALVCPASTGKLPSCGDCGACWHPSYRTTTIAFPLHGAFGPPKGGDRVLREASKQRHAIALGLIERAASGGERAPTNKAIAEACGLRRRGGGIALGRASEIVRHLEAKGLIRVQRFQASRIITLLATGQSTATPGNQRPHHMLKDVC